MSQYETKTSDYFGNSRTDLLSVLSGKKIHSLLELGAGGGYTIAHAKASGIAQYVCGVELFKLENTRQNDPSIDEFHHADLNAELPNIKQEQFDAMLCPDILEHLVDPWNVLERWAPKVKSGGTLLISIPNIREISVMRKIFFKGNFGYTEEGILDKTHLRFFCKQNLYALPSSNQFKDIQVVAAMHYQNGSRKRKLFNRLTFGLFEEFMTHQWFVIATKK